MAEGPGGWSGANSDSLNDFRQLIFALQSSPGFCGRGDELEHISLAVVAVLWVQHIGWRRRMI
jgi:hypothetical protein